MTNPHEVRDLTNLAERGVALSNKIAELAEELDAIKSFFRVALPSGEKDFGPITVVVEPHNRFDPDLASKVIPPELTEQCLTVVIDRAKVKEALSPTDYKRCCKPSTPHVKFQLVLDR